MSRRKHVKRGQRFGLIPDTGNAPLATPVRTASAIAYNAEWIYHSVPSDSQGDLGACVGYAWANWLEAMLRKHLGRDVLRPGEQIDGEAIWREGRRMFFPRERVEDGGLLLEHGFEAAVKLGVLPAGSQLVRVRRNDPGALSQVLRGNPLVIAQALHDGWNFARKDNGFIPRQKGEPWMGHAILMSGITRQRGEPFYYISNSWGTAWAWNGVCLMSEPHYRLNTLAMPAYAVLPDGWIGHDGWKRWVKMRPETVR